MARIRPEELESGVQTLLESFGTPTEIAEKVAASLAAADLRGHNSHGSLRTPLYGEYASGDRLVPDARPTVEHQVGPIARLDGQYAFGQFSGRKMMELANAAADEHGVGVVSIRNGTHLGRIGEWAEAAAEEGNMFMGMTRSSTHTVAMSGSAQRRLATNPVTYGVPTYDALEFPLVLDIATSQVAHGKIRELATEDEPIPDSWTITDEGIPQTDAPAFEDGAGALLPLGGQVSGYKGFGLAAMAELFGGILGDGWVADQEVERDGGNDAVFVVIDPLEFTTREGLEERVSIFYDYVHDTEFSEDISGGVAAYGDTAFPPGEPEHLIAAEQRENGIDLDDRIIDALYDFGEEQGVAADLPDSFRT